MSSSSSSRVIVSQQTARRTRKKKTKATTGDTDSRLSKMKKIPSMAEFVHRRNVVHQYRNFLQCIRRIEDDDYRAYAAREVKERFHTLSSETDKLTIQMATQEGSRRLAQVQSMVGYKGDDKKDDSNDEDSWINTKDKDDPRGRVGTSWPWEKK